MGHDDRQQIRRRLKWCMKAPPLPKKEKARKREYAGCAFQRPRATVKSGSTN